MAIFPKAVSKIRAVVNTIKKASAPVVKKLYTQPLQRAVQQYKAIPQQIQRVVSVAKPKVAPLIQKVKQQASPFIQRTVAQPVQKMVQQYKQVPQQMRNIAKPAVS